jgi:hypothetical protein
MKRSVVRAQATGKVVKHIESWDVEPGKVVRQLLKPAAKTPRNRWETLFAAGALSSRTQTPPIIVMLQGG